MYLCNCAGVTVRAVGEAIARGTNTLEALRAELGVCRGCRKCEGELVALIAERAAAGSGRRSRRRAAK